MYQPPEDRMLQEIQKKRQDEISAAIKYWAIKYY